MNSRRSITRGLLSGTAVFLTATGVMILSASQLSNWQPPSPLDPLHPHRITDAPSEAPAQITSSTLAFDIKGRATLGLLTAPAQDAAVGVVLVAGAGRSDCRSLLPLAEDLARSGFAVLTYDKRDVGYSALHRDFEQLADDVLFAVTALREATGITRVGALGVSEGGWVVSAAAGRPGTPLSFAMLVSAPIVSPLEQVSWVADRALTETPPVIRRASATVLAGGRTVVDYLDFDPHPAMAATDVPVLALWGAQDATVPVNEAYRRLRSALGARLSAHIVAETGHDLLANTKSWLPRMVRWMREPGGSSLTGVEPAQSLGVALPPQSLWFTDPRLHLGLSVGMAVITTLAVRQRAKLDRGRSAS